MNRRIDFHCHVLPGADHGSDSLACSLSQMKKAAAAGIDVIVATPHFYPDSHNLEAFLRTRETAYDTLCQKITSPNIIRAAEVAICPGLEKLEGLPALCVSGTDYILLEMPSGIWNDWVFETIFEIEAKRRLIPIIVHIDRYERKAAERLLEMKVMTQINAESLARRRERRYLKGLFDSEKAHVLGSDAHGEGTEFAAFSKAVKILGESTKTVMERAERILNNEKIR